LRKKKKVDIANQPGDQGETTMILLEKRKTKAVF